MLGIDIGSYSTKVVLAKSSGKKVTIEQAFVEVMPENKRAGHYTADDLRLIVSNILKKTGAASSEVVVSIPTSSAIMKKVNLEKGLNDEQLEAEVQLALVDFVPFSLEQVYFDFTLLSSKEKNSSTQDVYIVASRKEIVDKRVDAIRTKSVKKVEVDVEVFSLGSIIEKVHGTNYQNNYGIIDIGYQASRIAIFDANSLLFSREQQIGGQQLTEMLADAYGLDLAAAEEQKLAGKYGSNDKVVQAYFDSLSEQISLALELFTASDNSVEGLYLVGGGSLIEGLTEALADNIPDFKIEQLNLDNVLKLGRKANIEPQKASVLLPVATGLSMRK